MILNYLLMNHIFWYLFKLKGVSKSLIFLHLTIYYEHLWTLLEVCGSLGTRYMIQFVSILVLKKAILLKVSLLNPVFENLPVINYPLIICTYINLILKLPGKRLKHVFSQFHNGLVMNPILFNESQCNLHYS